MSKDMLGPLTRALVGVPAKMLGLVADIANKLGSADGAAFHTDLAKFVRNWRKSVEEVRNEILVLISAGKEIVIGATDGSRTIARAKDIFRGYIDSDFKNWGLDVRGSARPEAPVEVHEMRLNATFAEMFGSLGRPISSLIFTQDQIIDFCEKNTRWLRQGGYGTFFLFEENGEVFVAHVRVYSDGLCVNVYRFEVSKVWGVEDRRRIVVPKQDIGS